MNRMASKIAGLILAAGYSSRMGDLKALLPFGEYSVIERQIKCFNQAGITDIFVVLGYKSETIRAALPDCIAQIVINDNFDEGMFSSVQTGLKAIKDKGFASFLLMPVDYPLIQPYTLKQLIAEFEEKQAPIIYPVHNGKKGHPPLISSTLTEAVLNHNGDKGLKGVLKNYDSEAVCVETGTDSILIDIDTKDDYFAALSYFDRRLMPDNEECLFIFNSHKVSEQVVNHGKKVGEIAGIIGKKLNEKNFEVNSELLYTCGLLHDFQKGNPDHAWRAARILDDMGYGRAAQIVGNHMDIADCYVDVICEEAILYYADKIVKETKLLLLSERLNNITDKNVRDYAEKRLAKAKTIQGKLEEALQINLPDYLLSLEKEL